MTPVIHTDGPIWLVGIAWNAEVLAAFLAWWMPLNLLSYLAFLVVFSIIDEGEWEPKMLRLHFILQMTVAFWPWMAGRVIYCACEVFIIDNIKYRRALR